MAKADTYEEFSEILISPREPYDKKIVWIHPTEDNVEINIWYKNKWKTISQTKDTGLSDESKNQIEIINNNLRELLMKILRKYYGRFTSDTNIIRDRQKALEEQMIKLEDKFSKLNKKYSMIKYGK